MMRCPTRRLLQLSPLACALVVLVWRFPYHILAFAALVLACALVLFFSPRVRVQCTILLSVVAGYFWVCYRAVTKCSKSRREKRVFLLHSAAKASPEDELFVQELDKYNLPNDTTGDDVSIDPSLDPSAVSEDLKAQLPRWRKNDDVVTCPLCSARFNLTRRRHHCRKCGLIVCNECSSQRVRVFAEVYSEPQRVCDSCVSIR